MELQETVLVSEGEGESMAVHRFAPDELVIQDAVEDVVSEYVHCDEDEDVAVETCVMALDGEEEGVAMGDIPEDGLDDEQQEDDQDGCGDYLMISCKFTTLSRWGHIRMSRRFIIKPLLSIYAQRSSTKISVGCFPKSPTEKLI